MHYMCTCAAYLALLISVPLKNLLSRHTACIHLNACYKYTTTQRQATGPPTTTCDGSTEGPIEFN